MSYVRSNTENFPDAFPGWTWLGLELKNRGKRYGALEAWQQGIHLRPQDFRINFNIGILLAELGLLKDSIKFLEHAEQSALPETKEEELLKHIRDKKNQVQKILDSVEIARHNAILEEAKKIKAIQK